jgi:lipoprotein-anchoring transpeptidase ErfK/SrfK
MPAGVVVLSGALVASAVAVPASATGDGGGASGSPVNVAQPESADLAAQFSSQPVDSTDVDVSTRASGRVTANVWPKAGTYGVGVIPKVTFSRKIPLVKRAAVEQRLTVDSTKPRAGSWRWVDRRTALYRGAKFWPARSSVKVKAKLGSLNKGTGMRWSKQTARGKFNVDRKMVIRVNAATHKGTWRVDGRRIGKFVTSTGKAGFRTRSGIKTIMDKHRVLRMTNVGVTNDEVYDLQVPYAMRLTPTGEFLHAAPWNGRIGQANTSHGCTHLTLSQAKYFFDQLIWGDPVITKKTGRQMETTNGPGAPWNIPYSQWAN